MSKRHTTIQTVHPIPPDVPFQENLVFYAPLNEGELFDYISGEVGTTAQYAWVTWDVNEQMYELGFDYPTLIGYGCSPLHFSSSACLTNLSSCVTNRELTVVMQMKDVDYEGNRYQVSRQFSMNDIPDVIYNNAHGGNGMNMWFDGNRQGFSGNTIPSGARILHKAVGVRTATSWKTYVNGTQKNSATIGNEAWVNPTSLAILDKNGDASNQSSQYNVKKHVIYAKDIRIYDRSFTAQEVQLL